MEHFDLIVGTSTGGIIALGIGLGLSAKEILEFYQRRGPEIFRGNRTTGLLKWLGAAKYDPQPLRNALVDVFGDRLLGESKTRLVIPSLDLETGQVHVKKTAHHPRSERDYTERVIDVALATAAAPTYFPTHRSEVGIPLIDGGMWANNPMGTASVEALGVLDWQKGDVRLLSVGCTESPLSVAAYRKSRLGLNYWATRLIDVIMAGQSSASLGTAQLLLGHDNVYRVSPVVGSDRFKLDRARDIESLRALGASEARTQLPLIRDKFFSGPPPEPFVPYRKLGQDVAQ
ncbi:patatin-like phospholipase family protein [Mycobacteroides abscessus MAB_030201_1075]|uniref:Patatin-like phospholipase family protein n=1 Tax=Mycobacteroides abscessus MAB_030201_1075 TaxID=1335410 RepID=A0A829PJK9_9MYCO|nr:patatin-like phospholipase family protein [Mycobacteroides abscessus MAB_110811_1470]ETZ88205.1 patatin-like phospholipase family protein [Mycobacteroides abscessus MAB_030201_1075]